MGEMADFALDQVETEEEARLQFRTGGMGHAEAFERGIIDARGYEDSAYNGAPAKTCRCCGTSGLVWGEHNGKWRLFSGPGKLHECPANPLQEEAR